MSITENIKEVQRTLEQAAKRSGRDPGDITLVAVSKTVGEDEVEQAYQLGLRDFAENRTQELERKAQALRHLPDIRWHMIGHLQRNKVKTVLPHAVLIHSADSLRLLNEIEKRNPDGNRSSQVLLEVNISGEESKFGLSEDEAIGLVEKHRQWPNVSIVGLMTMAPFVDNPEETRPVFSRLRQLRDRIRESIPDGTDMKHLSMGMSNDYEVAVEEGATLVRIGTALWKER